MSPLMVRVQSVRSAPVQSIVETEPGCRARELNRFYPEVVIPSAPNCTTLTARIDPFLTVIAQPAYELGRRAFEEGGVATSRAQ